MPTISEDSIRFFEISSCDPLLIWIHSMEQGDDSRALDLEVK